MPLRIDLNCDMGESLGPWTMGADELLLRYVTSANIACGFHAGDPGTMRRTVRLAMANGVAIGAHPGLPDLVGFGRRELAVTPDEVYDMVVYQIGALMGMVIAEGGALHHVKPHGALYTMAARRRELADAIAAAINAVDSSLILVGLAGSELVRAGEHVGLRVAGEAFADRRYRSDGSLVPRGEANAVITDSIEAVQQVTDIIRHGRVRAIEEGELNIVAETICIHGDTPGAPDFAQQVRRGLEEESVEVTMLK